jgi:hypothetical protein
VIKLHKKGSRNIEHGKIKYLHDIEKKGSSASIMENNFMDAKKSLDLHWAYYMHEVQLRNGRI